MCVSLDLILLAHAQDTHARQRLSCVTIRTDETVASAARRITGDARNMQTPWFQIVNPTTSRWVPKTRYSFLFAGWNACIVAQPKSDVLVQPLDAVTVLPLDSPVAGGPVATAFPTSHAITRAMSGVVTWVPLVVWGVFVLSFALAYWVVDEYFAERERVRRTMQRFAERFVREFERPLIQQHLPERPIEARVRFKPARSRMDVLLAPHAGLRYPNLTDHKRNVFYDVVRVQKALQDRAFVSRQPYARGRWVVVPFQLRSDMREAGGR